MAGPGFLKTDSGFRAAIFAAGFLLSWLPLVLLAPTLPVVDELFQFLEAGHRLVFGYGLVSWEFDYGARSWLLGAASALPMGVGALLGAGPGFYVPLTWALFSLLAAGTTLCAGLWGTRSFGRAGGVAAALIAASWVDNLAFGGRVLSETAGAHLLILVVYLAEPGFEVTSRWRFVLAGFLSAMAVLLRVQLGPAALLLWLWRWRDGRRLLLLSAGGAAALVLDGAFDAVTAGYPFQPLWENVRFNLLLNGAASFGVPPWWYYFDELWSRWGLTLIPFVALAVLGGRRMTLLLAMAGLLLAVHLLVPHKEYRFLLPVVMIGAILCGLGAVDIVQRLMAALERRWGLRHARIAAALAVLGWTGVAGANATALVTGDAWHSSSALLEMVRQVSARPDICGLGFGNFTAYETGGYTFLHRPIPGFYSPGADQRGFIRDQPGYNAFVIRNGDRPFFESFGAFDAYVLDHCNDEVCLFVRPGACAILKRERPPIGTLRPQTPLDRRYPYAVGIVP